MWGAVAFATCLCAFELLQGTSPGFAGTVWLYILVSTLAFNVAGGMSRASGAYIFFQTVFTLILGLVAKAFVWEPADSNLRVPEVTILANLAFSFSLLLAATVKRYVVRKKALLDGLLTPSNTKQISLGCIVVAVGIDIAALVFGYEDGSLLSALRRVNIFLPLGMLISIFGVIRASGGRRNISGLAIMAIAYQFVIGGILTYSKEAMFTGLATWLIVVAATGASVSFRQIGLLGAVLGLIVYFMVPYSQGGRNDRDKEDRLGTAINNLSRIEEFREDMKRTEEEQKATGKVGPTYFDASLGLLERLQMVSWDDALIATAVNGSTIGYYPIVTYTYSIVPHFLWPDKPYTLWGNTYAHRIGILSDEDFTTGISFSPVGESYVLGAWNSIFFVVPFIYIVFFIVVDSLCGDVRKSPWGLFFVFASVHSANEQYLATPFNMTFFLAPVMLIGAYFTVYVLPIIGSLLLPTSRQVTPPKFEPAPRMTSPQQP